MVNNTSVLEVNIQNNRVKLLDISEEKQPPNKGKVFFLE